MKKKQIALAGLMALALASCQTGRSGEERLSPEASRVLDFIAQSQGRKALSATMANVTWNTAEADLVHEATGKYPAIIGLDYIDIYTDDDTAAGAYRPYDDFSVPQGWWDAGGLVTVCWHWNVPVAPDSARLTFRPDTEFRTADMLKDGTWEHAVMAHDLGLVAKRLRQFKEAGIPVLWRPLHEAAGNTLIGGEPWFWWGNGGAEAYVALWRYMHQYFSAEGLNNLIWVWTTETGFHGGDAVVRDTAWYPGDEYVDVIGRDSYHKDCAQMVAEYEAIRQSFPNKPLTLSECGDVATIYGQWSAGALWGWFMPWYQYKATTLSGHEWADSEWWADAANADFVAWRGDLPDFRK